MGDWESPITSDLITSSVLGLGAPTVTSTGDLFWLELRPSEGGRQVLVQRSPDGQVRDVTPAPDSGINVRTRVHEYGGGEYLVDGGKAYFTNFKDQRVYSQDLSESGNPSVVAITQEGSKQRFANFILDQPRKRLIAVCEDHTVEGAEAVNTISAIDVSTGQVQALASGYDFYSNPQLDASGTRLAWIQWKHPNMPWDGTELMAADVASDGSISNARLVAGGVEESVQQPLWGSHGDLYFISDRSEWWNLYRATADGQVEPLYPFKGEFGLPHWKFGIRTYGLLPDNKLIAIGSDPAEAGNFLAVLDIQTKTLTKLQTGLTSFGWTLGMAVTPEGGVLLAIVGGSSKVAERVTVLEVASVGALDKSTTEDWEVIKNSSEIEVHPGYLTEPRSIEFPTEGGLTAFMNFYPPKNKDHEAPLGEKPPLLVKIHGGPTAAASTVQNLSYQYWTSRGFAIADINYGGSTGFGRSYRNRLRGQWGVVDVDDCCNAAKYLAEEGLVDPNKLCIDGRSAGGYTTLACLAFRSVFAAGASLFGVADAELLAQHTHKFESRYLDLLIGPYPEAKQTYVERSPIHSADNIKAPIILFQGDEDRVVPPEQAELMYEAVKANGTPTALVMYAGEQHGFVKAGSLRSALDGERYFYGKVLGFLAAYPDGLQPIEIHNLPPTAT